MQGFRFRPLYAAILLGFAYPVCAQEAEDAVQTEDISVFGQGEVRQVQNITREDLQKSAPGANPIKVLDKLPGVHFQSADPLGTNEWSSRLTVRGFTQQYLGYTLDDIPLGDSAYAAHNGLSIGRAIIAENIGRVTLSQGAGALGTPSTSNLGGTVSFHSDDPENAFGARAALTLGTDNIRRAHARLDTGNFASGTKAYISALRQEGDNWKGGGKSWLNQFTAKAVNISGLNRFNLFLNHSDRRETDYQEISKEMVNRLGWGWDNYYPDWERAINAANGIYTGNVNQWDDAYWTSTTLRTDGLWGSSADLALDGNGNVRLKTGIYGQHSRAEGQWWALKSIPSPSGTPFSIVGRTYHTERYGLTSDLTWRLENQEIKAGVWFEKTNHDWHQSLYDADHPGSGLSYASHPFVTMNKQDFVTKTRQFYFQDTLSFLEGRGKLILGFKSPHVDIDAKTKVGSRAAGSITASDAFLPQLGINYQLGERHEVFAAYTENMRAFTAGAWGPFMVEQAVFDATDLEAETSKTHEVGYRYSTPSLKASAALYFTEFRDRLQVVSHCIQLEQCGSTLANVGKVESKGFEAALSWRPVRYLTWFNALTFNDTRYQSDYTDGGNVAHIRGKRVVDLPKFLFNTEIGYDTGVWFARLGGKYTDKRHYTFSNDASVPGFWVWDVGAGYRQKNVLGFAEMSVQLNVTNLFDKHYFGPLGTNGYVLNDPGGTFPTAEEGAPRQAFLTFNGKF
ncbi:MAG: TonB-dependent receptor [Zoogloeaceae bacterium]|jgi:iron complex outermembrane receptor protein|nr:TonB-dependent receptor [Zoogloeaceae bacterium]